MTLEELAKELGLDTDENKDKFSVLKKEFNAKTKEVNTLTKKVEKLEEGSQSSKDTAEKLDIVKKAFNLDMDAEDFDAMLDEVKDTFAKASGGGVTPEELKELKRELTKSNRERDKAKTSLEELTAKLTEEKNQRIQNNVRDEVRKALDANKIIKPEQTILLFTSKVAVDEDGSTFTIKGDDGSELSIADYVSDWAKDNPEFVKADTKGGAGSGLGGNAGGKGSPMDEADKFMESLLKNKAHAPEKSMQEIFG